MTGASARAGRYSEVHGRDDPPTPRSRRKSPGGSVRLAGEFSDGFARYKHIGEGAYAETEAKIRELLAERDEANS